MKGTKTRVPKYTCHLIICIILLTLTEKYLVIGSDIYLFIYLLLAQRNETLMWRLQ